MREYSPGDDEEAQDLKRVREECQFIEEHQGESAMLISNFPYLRSMTYTFKSDVDST